MDPNTSLTELRRLASSIILDEQTDGDALQMAELFITLDRWIADAGFLPSAWQTNNQAETGTRPSP